MDKNMTDLLTAHEQWRSKATDAIRRVAVDLADKNNKYRRKMAEKGVILPEADMAAAMRAMEALHKAIAPPAIGSSTRLVPTNDDLNDRIDRLARAMMQEFNNN